MLNSVKPMEADAVASLAKKAGEVCPKYELLVHFGVATGLRISDILTLKVKTVLEGAERGVFSVCEKKTGKHRLVTLDAVTGALVRSHVALFDLRDTDYMIFSRQTQKDRPLSRQQAWRIMRRVEAGLGTHSLRKTFAKAFYERTGDVEALQKALNHKYIDTTYGYLLPKDTLRGVLDALLKRGV